MATGNALQNLTTLHYSRRLYNGTFVPNASLPKASANFNPEDSVTKLVPVEPSSKDAEKAKDQMTPLAARLFGIYTLMAGIVRFYASYRVEDPSLYQLAIWTHVIAVVHFTTELLVFKSMRFSGPQVFPLLAGYTGSVWMILQYGHYVSA